MTPPNDRPCGPFVGVSVVVVRDDTVLLGRRRGSHGAGTWAFPGGKLDPGEQPHDAVARELHEETNLIAADIESIGWTNDVLADDALHLVTLHHLVRASGQPIVVESDKVQEWRWVAWNDLPQPLFAPTAALPTTGWRAPSR